MSLRTLASRAGVSPSYLSRVLRHAEYKTAGPGLVRRVAIALGLPEDYFLEFREAFVIDRIRTDARLREQLYRKLNPGPDR